MKIIEVSALSLRAMGIFLFLKLFGALMGWLAASESLRVAVQEALSKPHLIAIFAIPIGISLVLMKFPLTIARAITPIASTSELEMSSDGSVFTTGICLLGVYFIARSVPDLLYNLIYIIMYSGVEDSLGLKRAYLNEFITVIEMAIGLYLALGSRGISELIVRFRNAGLPDQQD